MFQLHQHQDKLVSPYNEPKFFRTNTFVEDLTEKTMSMFNETASKTGSKKVLVISRQKRKTITKIKPLENANRICHIYTGRPFV